MDDIDSLKAQIRALKFALNEQTREVALIREFLRTKRPIDFRDFESWSQKQSALWDAADKRTQEKMDKLDQEILDGLSGERKR